MQKFPHEVLPQCPWYDMAETYGGPNVNWCEATICSHFNEPANTWSNLTYIIVGLFIYFIAKKHGRNLLSWFGPALIVTGVGSFVYHATNNLLTQFLDFFGMYFLTGFLFTANLKRLNIISRKMFAPAFYGFVIFFSIAFYLCFQFSIPFQPLIVINGIMILSLELLCKKKSSVSIKYRYLIIGVAGVVLAEMFSILDLKRIMCDPNNHVIQGHAIWHVISAIAFLPITYFYTQFDLDEK